MNGGAGESLGQVVDDPLRRRPEADPARRARALASAARAAGRRGWSVVPLHSVDGGRCSCGAPCCPAPGKHPRIAWQGLMHRAATSEEVEHWWRRWPRSNLGLVTGAISDLVALDVDPRNGGDDTLAALEAAREPLPPTVETLTGGGGRHLYFRHPGLVVATRALGPGLEVKGDGGLVVSPPSLHASGCSYRWRAGRGPDDIAPADLPPWLSAEAGRPVTPAPVNRRVPSPRTDEERRAFADLWARVGLRLRPGDHMYLCPFHPDHHPSLHIDAEGCRFYCFGCARGGGIGRLRRLTRTQQPPEPSTPAVVAAHRPVTVTLSGDGDTRVVGESGHQQALLELTGGRRLYGGVRMDTVAALEPEPDNPADPRAITVRIAGQTVGHLSRADAARHLPRVIAAIARSGEATCRATIVGGWEREGGDVGYFGVHLRL